MIGLLLLVSGVLWKISKSRSFQFFGEIIQRVETDQRIVALTFDDGPWNRRYTNEVIAILKEKDVKATFFVNGVGVEKLPDDARRFVEEGHTLGNHAYSHDPLVFKSLSTVREQIERTNLLIRDTGFEGEIFFRPPYGKKLFVLPWYLSNAGITTVTWDIEPESIVEIRDDSQLIASHVIDNIRPGSIILLHVLGSKNGESRESIAPIIDKLRGRGYRFVLLPELLMNDV